MPFIDQINEDLKNAMREKRADDLSILRMLSSALKYKKIDLGNKAELTDEEAQALIKTEVKKRKDSIALYTEGNRPELAAKEQAEIDFLMKYLPEAMPEAEIERIVLEAIATTPDASPAKFGAIMALAMKGVAGRADGQIVSAIVKKLLAK
jgi:uncharacterized protein YqeY